MKKRVLITDEVHSVLLNGLEENNCIVDYLPEIQLDAVRDIIGNYDGLIINSKIKADAAFLEKAKQLKWLGRLGSGMEIIDQVVAQKKGITLISTPEGNCNAVAEHALGMVLTLFRNLNRSDRELRQRQWLREKNRGEELSGKTIGIIGYGYTGQRFEELLRSFNVKVLVYDKYKQLSNDEGRYSVVSVVNEIKESADLISLHLPLTPETKSMIDKKFIDSCRHSFYLVNTSRGQIVNTFDLLDALRSGKIKGACLDVFENEKPESFTGTENEMYDELYALEQVVLTPHIAGWTHQSKRRIAEIMLEKLTKIQCLI